MKVDVKKLDIVRVLDKNGDQICSVDVASVAVMKSHIGNVMTIQAATKVVKSN